MNAKQTTRSAFFNLRVLVALLITLTGVVLALRGFGTFAVHAANVKPPTQSYIANSIDPPVPPGFDCSKVHELGIDKQVNLRAGAIMIFCGLAEGRSASPGSSQWMQKLLPSPLNYGGTDVDLITGPDTWPNVTQTTTFTWMNPDITYGTNIVIGYDDVRCAPNNDSGASVSTDGGFTFTRLTNANGCSPFASAGTNYGDPVILYNRPTGYWYAIWLDMACGGQGIGYYRSTTPWDVNSWAHGCVHSGSNDDRESGWTDMNPTSPFYGRMYVSYNDFAVGAGALYVTHSDDGVVWTPVQLYPSFVRNVQITGDLVTGDVYVAGMNEGGGGLAGPRSNLIFRATDGGNTWTNTYTGPTFFGPGRCVSGYFACMYCSPSPGWRHMGWGQPAAVNHVVHYVYAQCGQNGACDTATDHGDVYYIRSTDSGVTFSAPFKLNTDTGTAAQWEPNLSVSPSGSVFAVWYDERTGGTCTPGANTPCYQMFARRSIDNGVTWLPDAPFSDVVSPLPGTPTGGIVGSDYDYQMAIATSHWTAWMDGRVPINNTQQADVFSDGEVAVGGTPTPTPSPAGCSAESPACGSIIVGSAPTDFIINLSAPADGAQGSDFTVNGTPANGATLSNGDTTITFHFNTSPAVQGQNTMHIPACAFPCGEPGGCVYEFTCTFTYQASTPTPTPTPTATPTPRSQPTPRPRPTPAPRLSS